MRGNASTLTRRNPNHSRSPGVTPERLIERVAIDPAGLEYSAATARLYAEEQVAMVAAAGGAPSYDRPGETRPESPLNSQADISIALLVFRKGGSYID